VKAPLGEQGGGGVEDLRAPGAAHGDRLAAVVSVR
jgi:hypothetical protein